MSGEGSVLLVRDKSFQWAGGYVEYERFKGIGFVGCLVGWVGWSVLSCLAGGAPFRHERFSGRGDTRWTARQLSGVSK